MNGISLRRRIAIAVVALVLASAFFRGQVAAALVTRGDDAMRNGDRTAGLRFYRRALAIDPHAVRAADRLAFAFAIRREAGAAQTAIAIATAALGQVPDDAALLADRGLAEQRLANWRGAEADFARAATVGRDARYDHFAGRAALRLGDRREARHFFASALLTDPSFRPARAALAQLQ